MNVRRKAKYTDIHSGRKQAILEWLSKAGDCNNADRHKQLLASSETLGSGLGEWFQQHKDFLEWMEMRSPSLLVYQGPGKAH